MDELAGLNEQGIPADVLPKVREWWRQQMQELAASHGPAFAKNREWLASYLNAEIRDRLQRRHLA